MEQLSGLFVRDVFLELYPAGCGSSSPSAIASVKLSGPLLLQSQASPLSDSETHGIHGHVNLKEKHMIERVLQKLKEEY